jgi:type II secretory pathway pseudopilin PulG
MNSIKCPQCGLTNWVNAPSCKRCSNILSPSPPLMGNTADHNHSENVWTATQGSYVQPSLKSGMALASMILGIIGFAGGCFGGVIMAPIGLTLGIIALVRANRRPFEYGGKGFAIAGTVLNSLAFVILPIILAIAIPNLLAARRAANEGTAISSIRTIAGAQDTYRAIKHSPACADLPTLAANELIDHALASGQKSGYRFEVIPSHAYDECEIRATPTSASVGTRSFYFSDGVIHAASKNGSPADASDPSLDENGPFARSR